MKNSAPTAVGRTDHPGPLLPKKCHYRSRAHVNPLSHNDAFDYPVKPADVDWATLYPGIPESELPTIVDAGCGFGGLTVALADFFPWNYSLGIEIRAKVAEYVRLRIEALRNIESAAETSPEDESRVLHVGGSNIVCNGVGPASTRARLSFLNVAVLRTNSMKYLPNFFRRGQLNKLFFCFPDPHFKAKNHRRRIVSDSLLSEYAYVLDPTGKGRLYLITDVEELHEWHVARCDAHPLFERLDDAVAEAEDPAVKAMVNATEEGKKVQRAGNAKFWAVYRRVEPRRDVVKAEAWLNLV